MTRIPSFSLSPTSTTRPAASLCRRGLVTAMTALLLFPGCASLGGNDSSSILDEWEEPAPVAAAPADYDYSRLDDVEAEGQRTSSRMSDAVSTAGTGIASVLSTLVYAPVKLAYAIGGTVASGFTYLFSGGNEDASSRVLTASTLGDYVITPAHIRGEREIHFIGREGLSGVDPSRIATLEDSLPPVGAAGPLRCDSAANLGSVRFRFGESAIRPETGRALDRVAEALTRCGQPLRIIGHADATGSADYNLALSRRRAEAIRQYLLGRGVASRALLVDAAGEADPVATNATAAGRAANRRAELPLSGSAGD